VIELRPMVSSAVELETAKEILAEMLRARPGEVEEMILGGEGDQGQEVDGRRFRPLRLRYLTH
jgi:hypothetical protein